MSLVHAQDIVAKLLEAVIDAASPALKLAKLEGDAAFFYLPGATKLDPALIAENAAAIHRAFHARIADIRANTICVCGGCQQAGDLKIKLVGHVGDVAIQKVKQLTELAGIDVILVHRMLKNDVPLPEYLLVTRPVYETWDPPLRERASVCDLKLDDLGSSEAFYVDLHHCSEALPPARKQPMLARVSNHMKLIYRTMPYMFGRKKACAGFRNVPDAP